MGKYKHHSGAVGGGVNLSKGKTPHDKDIKDMPLFKMGKPYEMGMSMRGPLDKHGHLKSDEKYDAKMAYNKNLSPKARMHYLENNIADHKGPSAYGKMKQGPLNQAKPDYIDIDGDGDKKESMKQAAAQKGPLNKNLVSMKNRETGKETAKPNVKSAAEENMKGQVLKSKVEKFMTKKVKNAAKKQ